MKKFKQLFIIGILAGAPLAGCGVSDAPADEAASQSEISSEPPSAPTNNASTADSTTAWVEFQGNVLSFNEDGAQLEKIIEEAVEAEGEFIHIGGTEENETINVFFTEDTQFELIVARFISSQESEKLEQRVASVDDIASDPLPILHVTGVWQSEQFIAQNIVIWRTVE